MAAHRKLTKEQVLEVHAKGLSIRESAKLLGVNYTTLWTCGVCELGLKFYRPRHPMLGVDKTPEMKKKIVELSNSGLSGGQIGKLLGVSRAYANIIAKREKAKHTWNG